MQRLWLMERPPYSGSAPRPSEGSRFAVMQINLTEAFFECERWATNEPPISELKTEAAANREAVGPLPTPHPHRRVFGPIRLATRIGAF